MAHFGRDDQASVGELFLNDLIADQLPAFEVSGHLRAGLEDNLSLAIGMPDAIVSSDLAIQVSIPIKGDI